MRLPLRAEDDVGGPVVAARHIPAEAKHPDAARILEDDGVVVELVAVLRLRADLPSADAEVRSRLEQEAAVRGWPAMHARLATVDAVAAARLKPNDSQRIQRALEVFEISGVPMSRLHAAVQRPALELATIALLPFDRAELHRRIAERFDAMLAAGFVDEAKALHARGDLHPELPAVRSVGYRQAWRYLDGQLDYDAFRAGGIAPTRQLAKRQITWLRSMQDVTLIDPFAADACERLRARVQETEATR